jgi:arabinofuranosyltransferase
VDAASDGTEDRHTLLIGLLLSLFATLLVRTAWLCDDAYITLRVVDNFWNGYGLRWNVVDRVQVYTHPLWMMALGVVYGITREAYYTTIAVSLLLAFAVACLVGFGVSLTRAHALLALWTLLLSKAFVDYSTSGLENPLSHLLIALFGWEYFGRAADRRSLPRLCVIAGLLALTRLDLILLVGPALLIAAFGTPRRRLARSFAIGFAPLALWMLFALFYYGFALPNTAYAKLNTGSPRSELIAQGFYYVFNSLSIDPLTLLVVAVAIVLPVVRGTAGALAWSLGLVASLAYVVRIGGDFMSGRFFAAPLLAAVIVLARTPLALQPVPLALAFIALGAVALSGPVPTLTTTAFFFTDRWERRTLLDERGITDERAIYYRYTGLMTARRGEPMPNHHRAVQGRRLRAEGQRFVQHGQLGILAFYAGPGVHVLDPNALTDAFLARLPAAPGWRIGHFARQLPHGYEATLRKDANRMAEPALRNFYRKVSLVTRGELLDAERLKTILDLNFGSRARVIDDYFRIHAGPVRVKLADISQPKGNGDDGQEGVQRFSHWGLEVDLGGVRHIRTLEISLDGNDLYFLGCMKVGVLLSERDVPPRPDPDSGVTVRTVTLREQASRWGCDTLRIRPHPGDQSYSLGHVRILEELSPEELSQLPPAASPTPAATESPADDEPDESELSPSAPPSSTPDAVRR